jgi:HJR/Mrr/RecB family endonuclease
MKVFIAHSHKDNELATIVAALLHDAGHEAFTPMEMSAGDNVLAQISAAIRSADLLVAILSGVNPNIFYELGLAAGASVPILLGGHSGQPLPADLATVPYVQFSGDLSRDAQMTVRRAVEFDGLIPSKVVNFGSAEATLRAASVDSALLDSLSPRKFEELVAQVLAEREAEVRIAPQTLDRGVDLIITPKDEERIVVVEVKKYSRQSRVSVEAVRRLLAIVPLLGASAGMLVSTSGFTAAALALAAGTPVVLRSLEELLAAKSVRDLLLDPNSSSH